MNEKIIKTYQAVIAELTFNTALHVGTGRDNPGTDAPVRRNNAGDLVIPGTAIAGALRTLATRLAPRMGMHECIELSYEKKKNRQEDQICDCAVCRLFGEFYPNKKTKKTEKTRGNRASRLWIYDAKLTSKPTDTRPFVRDGVGIDRRTGTAASAAQVKFDTEVVPAGAKFELLVEMEDVNDDDKMLLAAALAEWQAGRAWLGGNTGRGLGNAKLDKIQFMENDLSSGDKLLNYLKAGAPQEAAIEKEGWLTSTAKAARDTAKPLAKEKAPPFIAASFELVFDGPFLMHDGTAATVVGFDHLPLLDAVPGFDEKPRPPIMAGSGLRGVLRSHAERIARTIASFNAYKQDKDNAGKLFLASCPACNPLEESSERPLTRCDKLITDDKAKDNPNDEHLCLGCLLFGSTVRGSRLKVMDAKLEGEPRWKPLDFLAIDRFTGGGLEGAKFDAMALWKPTFNVQLFLEEPEDWELGWLALVLRDMIDQRLTFGFGAAKGFGNAKAQKIKIQCGFLRDDDWKDGDQHIDFSENEIKGESDFGFYRVAKFTASDWEAHKNIVSKRVEDFHDKLSKISRNDNALPKLAEDSYFGKVHELYPLTEV
jgi:CRISPR/Cas system CSM-associated protein Csm3 (group 7 of RAMP superfamily)